MSQSGASLSWVRITLQHKVVVKKYLQRHLFQCRKEEFCLGKISSEKKYHNNSHSHLQDYQRTNLDQPDESHVGSSLIESQKSKRSHFENIFESLSPFSKVFPDFPVIVVIA